MGLTANQGGTAGIPRPCPGDGVFVFSGVYLRSRAGAFEVDDFIHEGGCKENEFSGDYFAIAGILG